MKNLFKILALVFGVFLFTDAQGQMVSDSTIDLIVPYQDSLIVELQWKTPPTAVSCTIQHVSPLGTLLYPITNFTADSTTIPASNPQQMWDEFTIIFRLNGGRNAAGGNSGSVYDSTFIQSATYGGVVFIEENIFYSPVVDECIAPEQAEYFFFTQYCLIASRNAACDISSEYLYMVGMSPFSPYNIPPGSSFTEEDYTNFVIGRMHEKLTPSGENEVWDCNNPPPSPGFRKGITTPETRLLCSVSPNPFNNKIMLKPLGSHAYQESQVTLRDIMGRVVLSRNLDFGHETEGTIIETENWQAGLYFVTILQGSQSQTVRVIKQ